ncbi:asparaginase [Chitiniphilus purpureus]|uniref:Asparaginase n=1 Tax=Chitiniphilus purpureus TaxID=2981137 RepID=A0ABY6DIR4_9NEIS|nr:asparaginase [Chitiniphilus sp. CD1]UXY14217.1 asparaginase [Chitiniphilus sp. CD1]
MRNLIIYVGGTIGMRAAAGGLAPASGWLTQQLMARHPECDVLEYVPLLDSSSMTPVHWVRLAEDIRLRASTYRGVVVLHGTDTLAWTAAALAYQLCDSTIPVVLTGAMQPWDAAGSDAPGNVATALALVNEPAFREVGVVFAGRLWRATRVRKLDSQGQEAFATPAVAPLGRFDGERWILAHHRLLPPAVPPRALILAPDKRVVLCRLAPGFSAHWLGRQLMRGGCDALVLETYGSGNVPDHPDLLAALSELAQEVPVVNCTQCLRGGVTMGQYASSGPLVAAGVWNGAEMTSEAALVKLHGVLGEGGALARMRDRFESVLADDR